MSPIATCDVPSLKICNFFCPYYMSQVGLVTYLFIYFSFFSFSLIELVLKNLKKIIEINIYDFF